MVARTLMSTILFEQTNQTLTREVARWNRRLSLTRSALWGPRVVIVGLALGVGAALFSRMRPWLLPEQIAWGTGLFTGGLLLAILGWLWLRPQPPQRLARYFDRRFALQERTSTALEITRGAIPAPPGLLERQLDDAVRSARAVNSGAHLPVRVRWQELVLMVVLAGLLAFLLLSDNPQTSQLRAERALDQAIADQAHSLEQQIEEIDRNTALTDEEKEALRRPLEEALEILQQPEISQQEAVAAMAAAQQQLQEMTGGMLDKDRETYRQAAEAMAGADMLSDMARDLNRGDLAAAADAAEQLADDLDSELTPAEREDLAQRLEEAADALEESNPALAEQLREAAQAMREGDTERAEESMREAAETMREQQGQLQESEVAKQAQSATDRTRQGQQSIAQAGQEMPSQQQAQDSQSPDSPLEQGQAVESSQQADQSGEALQVEGSEGQTSDSESQSGAPGQSQQAGDEQSGSDSPAGDTPPDAPGQSGDVESGEQSGQSGPSSTDGEQTAGNAPGEGEPGASSEATSGEQSAAPSAGQGEGGAGVDTTQGEFGPQRELGEGSGSDGIARDPRPFDPEYASSSIGGESESPLDVGGQLTNENTVPMQEGDFAENPAGESALNYQSILGDYQGYVSDALESGRIPLAQRDVIHDYFSSLEP